MLGTFSYLLQEMKLIKVAFPLQAGVATDMKLSWQEQGTAETFLPRRSTLFISLFPQHLRKNYLEMVVKGARAVNHNKFMS